MQFKTKTGELVDVPTDEVCKAVDAYRAPYARRHKATRGREEVYRTVGKALAYARAVAFRESWRLAVEARAPRKLRSALRWQMRYWSIELVSRIKNGS
jgi:hypothetical protein